MVFGLEKLKTLTEGEGCSYRLYQEPDLTHLELVGKRESPHGTDPLVPSRFALSSAEPGIRKML